MRTSAVQARAGSPFCGVLDALGPPCLTATVMPEAPMSYHTATFRLLNSEPKTSIAAEVAVQEVESRLGHSLPSSVREWYTGEDAIQILAEHSNQDPPIAVQDFAVIERQSRRLLPIRRENQGVCTWAIVLDGSEDPPVYVDVDSDGKEWRA